MQGATYTSRHGHTLIQFWTILHHQHHDTTQGQDGDVQIESEIVMRLSSSRSLCYN